MNYDSCIHCGKCTESCDFLTKYKIDLSEFAKMSNLAYHCFLCGSCAHVCPKNIDGRKIALDLRKDKNFSHKSELKVYKLLILEKENYLFKNYKNAAKSVLFPGCNFPSFYPKTTKKLVALLKEKADIGVLFDCCGKPIADLGKSDAYSKIKASMKERMYNAGITQIIALCPNCYYFLKENLDIPVISIYEKLEELGFEIQIQQAELNLFIPCPDKESKEIYSSLLPFIKGNIKAEEQIQCCGLGGLAAPFEPQIAEGFSKKLKDRNLPSVYTYCASCAGSLNRSGCNNVKHVLPQLLKTYETPPKGIASLLNRAKFKFL